MIALIARAHLTAAAAAAVDTLLRQNPIASNINVFCKDAPDDLMAQSADWADDVRNMENNGEQHYIDIPLAVAADAANSTEVMQWCKPVNGKPGCVLSAIDFNEAILIDPVYTPAQRTRALRYLIHFVGDLAQPLHSTDNHDRGGNCTAMHFPREEKLDNLHTIWDTRIIAKDLADRGLTRPQYAATIDRDFAGHWPEWGTAKPDALAWAWQSHALALSTTYGKLQPGIPVAPASAGIADPAACDAGKSAVEAEHISIGDDYLKAAVPAIREQLARAGYELAGLLNQTLK